MIFGRHINKYYLKYSYMLIIGLAALILVDYFQLKIPELYKMLINGINEGSVSDGGRIFAFDMDFLLDKICFPMIITIITIVVCRFIWRICFFGAAIRVETDIRNSMFDHCKDLSREYYQVNKVGTLMSLFINDLETVQDCFGSGFLMFFDALILGMLSLIKMWRMDRLLTLFSMAPMVLLFAIGTLVGRVMMKKWEIRQEAFSDLSDFSQESFSGIAVIKAFVKETRELMAFRRLNKNNEDANVDFTRASTFLNILVVFFVESIVCVILGYGGYLVYKGSFNAGELIEFIGYFSAIVWPVTAVSQLIDMTARGKASLGRIGELLDAKQDVTDREDVSDPGPIRGEIEFRDLTFRYPGGDDRDALRNVSFHINAGECVGLVGRTGSGKTTIVDLILRMYNVPDKTVYIDGHDINSIPIKAVREASSYVPQDNFLFSDTIENNIDFTKRADKDGVEDAAKLSDVHDDICGFKDMYATVLGERGVTVSGGQKQRISIARALVKDAAILILDDSVSAVDTNTEKVILENLRSSRKGRTTILIAHRISTVRSMDKIIFIDDGTVLDAGTHDELYERCPAYAKMVDLQKLEDEEADYNA